MKKHIFIILLINIGLCACQDRQAQRAAFRSLTAHNFALAERLDKILEAEKKGIDACLDDPSLEAYRNPIRNANAAVEQVKDSFLLLAQQLRNRWQQVLANDSTAYLVSDSLEAQALESQTEHTKARLYGVFSTLLEKHGKEPFGLRNSDISNEKEEIATIIRQSIRLDSDSLSGWAQRQLEGISPDAALAQLSVLELSVQMVCFKLILKILQYKSCLFADDYYYFPVIMTKDFAPKRGDSLKASIGVGHYGSHLQSQYVKMKVNGEYVSPRNEYSAWKFRLPTTTLGRQSLVVSSDIYDHYTHKNHFLQDTFYYEVVGR